MNMNMEDRDSAAKRGLLLRSDGISIDACADFRVVDVVVVRHGDIGVREKNPAFCAGVGRSSMEETHSLSRKWVGPREVRAGLAKLIGCETDCTFHSRPLRNDLTIWESRADFGSTFQENANHVFPMM